jgi:hypothetical protein
MAKKNKVFERDMGWKRILRETWAMKRRGVKVGVLGDAERNDGQSMIDIAVYNEFGTEKIPPRPFIRGAYDSQTRELGRFKDRLMSQVLAGRVDTERALKILGEHHKGQIQKYMTALDDPPNAPATIEAKGSSNPLVEHGQLRRSIDWELD